MLDVFVVFFEVYKFDSDVSNSVSLMFFQFDKPF